MNSKIARRLILGYVLIAIFGAILLSLLISQVKHSNFLDALFTSSAVSLTGFIVKNTATDWSVFGQIVTCIDTIRWCGLYGSC